MPSQQELELLVQQLAPALKDLLADQYGDKKVGFCLTVFEFGERGAPLAFISDAQPAHLADALVELVKRLPTEGRIVTRVRG
jgi:hypothetical protein